SGVRSISSLASTTSSGKWPPCVNQTSWVQPCLYSLPASIARKGTCPPKTTTARAGWSGSSTRSKRPACRNANAAKAAVTKVTASHPRPLNVSLTLELLSRYSEQTAQSLVPLVQNNLLRKMLLIRSEEHTSELQ